MGATSRSGCAVLIAASLVAGCSAPISDSDATRAPQTRVQACSARPPLPALSELVLGDPQQTGLASNAVFDVALAGGRAIAASPNGVSVSDDGGQSWRVFPARANGVRAGSLAVDGDVVVSPTLQLSQDGGRSWAPVEIGAEVVRWARVALAKGALYVAREGEPLLRSVDLGAHFDTLETAAPTAWDVAAEGDDLAILQAADEDQGFSAYLEISRDGGQSFVQVAMPLGLWTDEVYPWGPISLVGGRLFMTNGGKVAALDLTTPDAAWSVTELARESPSLPYSLSPVRRRGDELVVLHRRGALFVSRDGAQSFREETTFHIPEADALHPVSAVSFDGAEVLVGFVGHVLPETGPGGGIALSRDRGASFTRAVAPHPLAMLDASYQRVAVDGAHIAVASFATLVRLNAFEGRGFSPGVTLSTSHDDGRTWSHRWLAPSALSPSGCQQLWFPGALVVRDTQVALTYQCAGGGSSGVLLSHDGQAFDAVPLRSRSGELPRPLMFGEAGLFFGGTDGLSLLAPQSTELRALIARPAGLTGEEARKYDVDALLAHEGGFTAVSRDGLWRIARLDAAPVHVPGATLGPLPWDRYAYARSGSRELVSYRAQVGFGPGAPVTLSSPPGRDIWSPFAPFPHGEPLSFAQAGNVIAAYAKGVLQISIDGGETFAPGAVPTGDAWTHATRSGGSTRICLGTLCTEVAQAAP